MWALGWYSKQRVRDSELQGMGGERNAHAVYITITARFSAIHLPWISDGAGTGAISLISSCGLATKPVEG